MPFTVDVNAVAERKLTQLSADERVAIEQQYAWSKLAMLCIEHEHLRAQRVRSGPLLTFVREIEFVRPAI